MFTETGLVDRLQRTPFLDHSRSLPLRHELFEKDAIILDQLASKSVQLLSKKSGKGLEFAFADFENLVLWSTNNKGPFIALEPWTGISTSAEEGDFFEYKRCDPVGSSRDTESPVSYHHFVNEKPLDYGVRRFFLI